MFFSKTANGHPLNDKAQDYDGNNPASYDPWGYSKGGEFNGDDFRKALYEDTRDRANQELANGHIKNGTVSSTDLAAFGDTTITPEVYFTELDATTGAGLTAEAIFESGKWGKDGAHYVDGLEKTYSPLEARAF